MCRNFNQVSTYAYFSEWFHVFRSRIRSIKFFSLNSNREPLTTMGDQSFVLIYQDRDCAIDS